MMLVAAGLAATTVPSAERVSKPSGHVVQQPGVEGFQALQAPVLLVALQESQEQNPEDDGHRQDVPGLQDGRALVFAEGRQMMGHVDADEQERRLLVRRTLAVGTGGSGSQVRDASQDHDGLTFEVHFAAPFPGVADARPGDGRQLALDRLWIIVRGEQDVPEGVVEADEAGVGALDVVLEQFLGQGAMEVQKRVGCARGVAGSRSSRRRLISIPVAMARAVTRACS